MADNGTNLIRNAIGLFDRAYQQLPSDTDTGLFANFVENSEYALAWQELAATGKGIAAGSNFWSLMADAARLLGMGIEARKARSRAIGESEITIRLPEAEALILFNFLYNASQQSKQGDQVDLSLGHRAEGHIFAYLLNILENALLDPSSPNYLTLLHHGRDPFWPDYHGLVERARMEIEEEWGTV
ncbi:MAG: hypothetical protein ACR2JW_02560 [Thermomicrobiales bacterium]